jgi:SAM-dependent methyltransferase
MAYGGVAAREALNGVLDEVDAQRVRRMVGITREGREGPYGLRFDHVGILIFPRSVEEALAGLAAEGLSVVRTLPSVVVRQRLALRYGLEQPEVLIANLDVGAGRRVELFLATGCPGHVADDERIRELETHLAFTTTTDRLGVLEALRADGFLPDGGGYNPAEGDQGCSVFYFRDGPDGERLEVTVAGQASGELSRHLGAADVRRRMLDLLTGAWQTQALRTAAELGIADRLLGHSLTLTQLADATGCPADRLGRLLRYLRQLGVIDERDGRIALTPLGATLSRDAPSSLHGVALLYGGLFYHSFGELPDTIRSSTSGFELTYGAPPFEYLDTRPDDAMVFQRAMSDQCRDVFDAIADQLDLTGINVVTDVGGGTGALLGRILDKAPHVSGVLFDTQATVNAARAALQARHGTSISTVGGDLFTGVPGGDLLILSRVLHDWDDAACASILAHCRTAMRPGGRLAVVERLLPGRPGGASLAAAWDVHMMVNNTAGQERTLDDYRQLLNAVGFVLTACTDLPLEVCLLQALAV